MPTSAADRMLGFWTVFVTYFVLNENASIESVRQKLPGILAGPADAKLLSAFGMESGKLVESGRSWEMFLTPMRDITPSISRCGQPDRCRQRHPLRLRLLDHRPAHHRIGEHQLHEPVVGALSSSRSRSWRAKNSRIRQNQSGFSIPGGVGPVQFSRAPSCAGDRVSDDSNRSMKSHPNNWQCPPLYRLLVCWASSVSRSSSDSSRASTRLCFSLLSPPFRHFVADRVRSRPADCLSPDSGMSSSSFNSRFRSLSLPAASSYIVSSILVQQKNLGFDKDNVLVLENVEKLGDQATAYKDLMSRLARRGPSRAIERRPSAHLVRGFRHDRRCAQRFRNRHQLGGRRR